MRAAAPIGCRRCGSPVATGLPLIVGAGFIPPAGVCAAAGVRRRCRASPPYRAPAVRQGVAAVPVGSGPSGRFVGAGFIPPGTFRRSRVPGTISGLRAGPAARLASETRLRAQCKHRPLQRFVVTGGPRFPGWPRHSPSSVGVDSISARGRLRPRGVRRDEGIPPYGRLGGRGRPVWSEA